MSHAAMIIFDGLEPHRVSAEVPFARESHACDFPSPVKLQCCQQERAIAGKAKMVAFVNCCTLRADPGV